MRIFNTPDGSIDAGDRTFLLTRRFDLDLSSVGPSPVTPFSRAKLSVRRRDAEAPQPSSVTTTFRRTTLSIRRR